jgi:transposase
VAGHTRRTRMHRLRPGQGRIAALFFDEARVPVETITVANPDIEGLTPDQYEVIGEKVSHRLAQRPGSYVILKYVRPVIKRRDTQTIHCPAAPAGVIDGSRADVSFLVGLLLDKFAWHLPLYRQHQRLLDAGITVSRAWLTQLAAQAPRCSSRSTRPSWPRSVPAASRPWTRPRSRPAAPARAR